MQPISTNGPNVDAQCNGATCTVMPVLRFEPRPWHGRPYSAGRAGKDAISHTTSFLTPDCPNAPIIVGFLGHAQTRVGIIFCVQFIAFSSMEFDFDFSSIIQL